MALLADMAHMLTLHLDVLNTGFRYVYSTELYLLGTSWRLFRGKKLNILRHRTDTMEYDSMQLLLGSILFVMTLFLLTTILVYYAFFTILYLVVGTGSTVLLWVAYTMIQDFPFGSLSLRILHPDLFTSTVVIIDIGTEQQSDCLRSKLEPIPQKPGSILTAHASLMRRAQAFTSWVRMSVSDIFSGRQTTKAIVEYLVETA